MLPGGGAFYLLFNIRGFGYGTLGGMMGGYGTSFESMGSLVFISLVAGLMVTVGALLLNSRPAKHITWGALILVFSLIGFLDTEAFFIGAILSVIGGVLALSWRPAHEEHLR